MAVGSCRGNEGDGRISTVLEKKSQRQNVLQAMRLTLKTVISSSRTSSRSCQEPLGMETTFKIVPMSSKEKKEEKERKIGFVPSFSASGVWVCR